MVRLGCPIFWCTTWMVSFSWGCVGTTMYCETKTSWWMKCDVLLWKPVSGPLCGSYFDVYNLSERCGRPGTSLHGNDFPMAVLSFFHQDNNESYHTTSIVWEWFAEHKEEPQVLSWPPVPHINPTEHQWLVLHVLQVWSMVALLCNFRSTRICWSCVGTWYYRTPSGGLVVTKVCQVKAVLAVHEQHHIRYMVTMSWLIGVYNLLQNAHTVLKLYLKSLDNTIW